MAGEILALRAATTPTDVVAPPSPGGHLVGADSARVRRRRCSPTGRCVTPWAHDQRLAVPRRPPPARPAAEYTAAFREVKRLGRSTASCAPPSRPQIALFWADGAGTATPPGHWHVIAQDVSPSSGAHLLENARLFALLAHHRRRRRDRLLGPQVLLRPLAPGDRHPHADLDGNPATAADPAWPPLIATPPFPSYTSGHSTFSGAARAPARALLRHRRHRLLHHLRRPCPASPAPSPASPQAAEEAGQSRIYGGIHWQYDNQVGLASGRALAEHVFFNFAAPVASRSTAATSPRRSASAAAASAWRPTGSTPRPPARPRRSARRRLGHVLVLRRGQHRADRQGARRLRGLRPLLGLRLGPHQRRGGHHRHRHRNGRASAATSTRRGRSSRRCRTRAPSPAPSLPVKRAASRGRPRGAGPPGEARAEPLVPDREAQRATARTRRPPTQVPTARPRSSQPANGVLRPLLRKLARLDRDRALEVEQRDVGGGAGPQRASRAARSRAPGRWRAARRAATGDSSPGRTSRSRQSGTVVSSPTMPKGASWKLYAFSSGWCGAWSEAMASTAPSASPRAAPRGRPRSAAAASSCMRSRSRSCHLLVGEQQVVRRHLAGHRQAAALGPRAPARGCAPSTGGRRDSGRRRPRAG